MAVSFGDQITALSDQLNEIKDQVASLAAENRAASLAGAFPSPVAPNGDGDEKSHKLLSRRGLLAGASATAAGLLIAGHAAAALAKADGDPVLLGDLTNNATADTKLTTTSDVGLEAESTSTSGTGVLGVASTTTGSHTRPTECAERRRPTTCRRACSGLRARCIPVRPTACTDTCGTNGSGVYGLANNESGAGGSIYGVKGTAGSEAGVGVRMHVISAGTDLQRSRTVRQRERHRCARHAPTTTGPTTGVEGSVASTSGKGLYGLAEGNDRQELRRVWTDQ